MRVTQTGVPWCSAGQGPVVYLRDRDNTNCRARLYYYRFLLGYGYVA